MLRLGDRDAADNAYPHQGQMGDAQADLALGERRRNGDVEVLVWRLRGRLAVVRRLVRASVDDVAEHLADVGRRALGGALGAAAGPEADRDTDFRRPSEGVLRIHTASACQRNGNGSVKGKEDGCVRVGPPRR